MRLEVLLLYGLYLVDHRAEVHKLNIWQNERLYIEVQETNLLKKIKLEGLSN